MKKFFSLITALLVCGMAQAIIVSTHDTNHDGYINGADVTSLYAYLLGQTTDGTDVNDDGYINGADVTSLYDWLLNGSQAPKLITIAELKEKFWQEARNCAETCDEDIVIAGRVTADDRDNGNIYKTLYIEDKTGGIGISVNNTKLYLDYPLGSQIEIALKDLAIGKYNSQMLVGKAYWYEHGQTWETDRLDVVTFATHTQKFGAVEPDKVVPTVCRIGDFANKNDKETQLYYQNRLVRLENVKWEEADGVTTYNDLSYTAYRTLVDEEGNTIQAPVSEYSQWKQNLLPFGRGNVTGVLNYVRESWHLKMRDENDCDGFSTSTKGALIDPYTVDEAIEEKTSDDYVWVTGYIVGAVKPGVTEVHTTTDVEWTAPTALDNTLVIGATATTRDLDHCIVVELPQGSDFHTKASLSNYPELLGTQIFVNGKLGTVMGTNGIVVRTGSQEEFKLSITTGGLTELNEDFENGIPAEWKNIQVKGDKAWYQTSFDNNGYAAMTGYKGTAPFESWLITPAIDIKRAVNRNFSFRTQVAGYGSSTTKLRVFILSSDDPTTAATVCELNPTIATAPASGYSEWTYSGDIDLSAYADGTYCIGFCYEATTDANYATWCVDDVTFGK